VPTRFDSGRHVRPRANEASGRPGLASPSGRAGDHRRQASSKVVLAGRAPDVPFLAAGLIDRVVAYIAPVLIGGGGKPALAGPGALNIADAKRFQLEDVVRIGPDVRLTATPLR
jgi:diaminohydroxyphosphoribosylaminopyrimidine deaminase / 5-amino-6-(5-phosphoribosylamino)uracil reductase